MNTEHWMGEVSAKLATLTAEVKTVRELLQGNGRAGMIVRVDRLEQQGKLARWILATVIVAVVGLVVQAAAAVMF